MKKNDTRASRIKHNVSKTGTVFIYGQMLKSLHLYLVFFFYKVPLFVYSPKNINGIKIIGFSLNMYKSDIHFMISNWSTQMENI